MGLRRVGRYRRIAKGLGRSPSTISREELTQRWFAGLPCKPGRQARVGAALRPEPSRLVLHQGVTMVRGAEACAAMVARADLRSAEAAAPDTQRRADISTKRSMQSLVQTRGVLKKVADGTVTYKEGRCASQRRQGQEWTGTDTRYGSISRATRRGRGSRRAAIGKETSYRSKRHAHRDARRAPQPLYNARQASKEGARRLWWPRSAKRHPKSPEQLQPAL